MEASSPINAGSHLHSLATKLVTSVAKKGPNANVTTSSSYML